ALMNPLMILVKIIKLRWIHILSYDQMVSRKINNQTTRCANSIFYTTLFTNSAPNYT
ncbi:LPS core heptose(II) kinase RfaY, partial [Citrobacter braakii]